MRPFGLVQAIALGLIIRFSALLLFDIPPFPDATAYASAGSDLLKSGHMVTQNYMPLYPLWVVLWGGGIGLQIADIGLSVATIIVLYHLTTTLFDDGYAARIAAFASAVYPHFVFYALTGLTETAYVFVVCTAFLCFYKERWGWGSLLLVMSILIRPALDLAAPVLIVAFAVFVHRRSIGTTYRKVALYGLVYAVMMSPWWLHNYAKYGHFVRLNLGDGAVLYAGNNPKNQTGGGITDIDVDMSVTAEYSPSGPDQYALNERLKGMAWQFIRENPGRFVELAALKFVRFWRLWPFTQEFQRAEIVVISVLSYGVILILGLVGLFRELSARWRLLSPILLFSGYLTVVHMITIGSIRYRFPIEPFLIILASRAAADLSRTIPLIRRAADRYST